MTHDKTDGLEAQTSTQTVGLPSDWAEVLDDEVTKPYWVDLQRFVASERAEHEVYPAPERVFAAFDLTTHEDTRVVILGQDPYPNPGQAHGLCFSVPAGVTKPPSLRTILRELQDDLGFATPEHGDLTAWARQGVLLLNTTLTVRRGDAGSHRGHGWEEFTDAVVSVVNDKPDRLVFVLWGQDAHAKQQHIDTSRHRVVTAAHPAARPNAKQSLAGSKPFSTVNRLLVEAGSAPIDWAIT